MNKKATVILATTITALAIIAIAWLGYAQFFKKHSKVAPQQAVQVKVRPIQEYNIPVTVSAVGQVIAPNTMMIKAKQPGEIVGIYFKSGQWVRKGQLLLKIDDISEKAVLAQQQANYQRALTEFKRYRSLQRRDKDAVAADVVSQKLGIMRMARAQVEEAKKQLQDTNVLAPFAGIIGTLQSAGNTVSIGGQQIHQSTQLTIGSYLQTGAPIALISDPKHVEVEYQVPQQYSRYLKLGQPIALRTTAYPGQQFTGTVNYVSPVILENSQAYNVRAMIGNDKLALKSGMSAMVTQTLQPKRNVLAVFGLSLVPDLSGYSVYTIQNSKVKATPVKIGQRFNNMVAVLSGLKQGEPVIVSGMNKIHEGSLVKVVK